MSRATQTETLPGVETVLPAVPAQNLENGKGKAEGKGGVSVLGEASYTGYTTQYETYAVVIVERYSGGELSERYTPGFEPLYFDTPADFGSNTATGALGAWQAMICRAALFAKQGWCEWAGVERKPGGALPPIVWHVSTGDTVTEWKEN